MGKGKITIEFTEENDGVRTVIHADINNISKKIIIDELIKLIVKIEQ